MKLINLSNTEIEDYTELLSYSGLEYFAGHFVKLSNHQSLTDFIMNPAQETLFDIYKTQNKSIGKIARQMGTTTSHCIFSLYSAMTQRDQTIAIVGINAMEYRYYNAIIRQIYENLPSHIKRLALMTTSNRSIFEFDNGSRILLTSYSDSMLRGMTCNTIIFDNIGHINSNCYETIANLLAIFYHSKIIISVSGNSNEFVDQILNNKSFYTYVIDAVNYDNNIDLDQIQCVMGLDSFKREYLCEF